MEFNIINKYCYVLCFCSFCLDSSYCYFRLEGICGTILFRTLLKMKKKWILYFQQWTPRPRAHWRKFEWVGDYFRVTFLICRVVFRIGQLLVTRSGECPIHECVHRRPSWKGQLSTA